MAKEIQPKDTSRAMAYEFWMKAPNPMVTFFKTLDVTNLIKEYLKYTSQVAESCQDRDLSADSMVIGTSAIIDTEIDGAVGMNSGIFNNPFIIWGRYKKKFLHSSLDETILSHQ